MFEKEVFLGILFLTFFCSVICKGEKIIIKSKNDFNNLIQLSHTAPFNCDVELNIDLDFDSEMFQPLGQINEGQCIPYSGTFDGKGHSIKNLFVGTVSSSFFCHLANAVIKNVIFESSCLFRGDGSSSVTAIASEKVILQNVINRASVTGFLEGAAGLVHHGLPGSRIYFLNCINEGDVYSREILSCGLTCANQPSSKVFVLNSINKGSVSGLKAFGISPWVFFGDNVVNAGSVTGSLKDSFWDWESSLYTFNVYGIDAGCTNCDADKVSIFKKKSSGSFYLKKTKKRLEDVLNKNAKNMHYGYLWTKELNLEEESS